MRKHNARIMGFESMLKHLARLKIKRGVGGGSTPPPPPPPQFANAMLASEASKRRVCFEASWHGVKEGGLWGEGGGAPICKHNARIMGFETMRVI